MYLENTKDFDIHSSQNMREFYITDKGGNYIEDKDEATNYSLEEIKNCYQFSSEKLRVLNIRSQPSMSIKREPKKKLKRLKYFPMQTMLLITQFMKM